MLGRISPLQLIAGSAVLRALLIVYGTIQDSYADVRYTDIDYDVFTGAARFVTAGDSPYARATYRYTPLLAYLLIPNITFHIAWGKALFAVADIAAAVLIQWRIAQRCAKANLSGQRTTFLTVLALAAWLCNPYTATISTRGNGDALVVVQQLLVLILLQLEPAVRQESSGASASAVLDSGRSWSSSIRIAAAGAVYGLLVHWRVFPVIYGPSLVLFFWIQSRRAPRPLPAWLSQCTTFGVPALAVFFSLGAAFYKLYGQQFLHEAFLYHASRHDPRHNFSPHFLFTYLHHFSPSTAQGMLMRPDVPLWLNPGTFSPLCMAAALLAVAVAFSADLDMCWLLSTIVFVAFNKVSTAQYFVWYLGILPVVLPTLVPSWRRLQWASLGTWVTAQLLWLSQAYRLEFLGEPVFENVWMLGLCLMAAHVFVVYALADAYRRTHALERETKEE